MARLTDYMLSTDGADWNDLLAGWAWLVPREFTIWFVNRFGDLFIVLEDETVWRLDVGVGSIAKLAESREDFANRIDDEGTANDWLMIPLVDELVSVGANLPPGHCYSYLQLPVLGGEYTVANTRVVPLAQHYKAFGPIHESIKDLPEGTRVKFDVTD